MGHFSTKIPVTQERLESKFYENILRVESGCWEWQNIIASNGYGVLQVGKVTGPSHYRESVHRFSYRLHKGPIPDNMNVLHRCDNRKCCNPEHLFLGTHDDNMKDKIQKGRQSRGSRAGRAKLTEMDIVMIFAMRDEGLTFAEIAKRFNVARPTIGKIINRITWTHLGREDIQ